MDFVEFPIEFQSSVTINEALQEEIEKRLLHLSGSHKDMTGAAIAITEPGKADTAFLYQARIVVYTRPNDVVAVKQSDTVEGALKGAVEAVERQIREQRDKLRETWKRQDIPGTPAGEDG